LTGDDVRKVARLARLVLTDEEVAAARRDLEAVLDYMRVLDGVDTAGVAPAPYPFATPLPLRVDAPEPDLALPAEALCTGAPAHEDGQIVVPRVVE